MSINPEWSSLSNLATGAGTLVLAVATFAAVRSSNRSAQIAQEALRVGMRPLLVPSRLDDVTQKVFFGDGVAVRLEGGRAAIVVEEESRSERRAEMAAAIGDGSQVIYLAISVRNAGAGIAVLRRWSIEPEIHAGERPARPDVEAFRRHYRDIYIPPGDVGFWQGAIRVADDGQRDATLAAVKDNRPLAVDIHYSDHEGGQQAISRFVLRPFEHHPAAAGGSGTPARLAEQAGRRDPGGSMSASGGKDGRDGVPDLVWLASVVRHWNLDRPDPRDELG